MDIIDILLAKAMTPQGQIETYAAKAATAATQASQALSDANEAIEYLDTISSNVGAAAATEIDKLALTLTQTDASSYISNNIQASYPSNKEETLTNVVKYYKTTGNNEDGTMTQKAITEALSNSGGGGVSNLGSDNAGKIVIVDQNGNITSSTSISENDLINALEKTIDLSSDGIVGLSLDYQNYSYIRTQEAQNYTQGNDFNNYAMYGGRKRCLVSDNGQIIAFYGDNNYNENISNGYQVMVYQPKFYYRRVIDKYSDINTAKAIRKQNIMISRSPKSGFKIHPLFINENGDEIEYVLLPAYEGSVEANDNNSYTNKAISNFTSQKLASVAGANPITGLNNPFTIENAEQMAKNRGTGWHITNIQFESAMQILFMIEFGTPNGQAAIEKGISDINSNNDNVTIVTGSTSSLGNNTGYASFTDFIINDSPITYSQNGKRAISYRGVQNPWGNLWRYAPGIAFSGDGTKAGGETYICNNYNYDVNNLNNYTSAGFNIPNSGNWISSFGYNNEKYDWIFIPIEATGANSSFPIGDYLWVKSNLNGTNILTCGGSWKYGTDNGLFYYACDRNPNEATERRNARLMYVPLLSNQYYESNIIKWQNHYGG